jgi:lysozyme
MRLGQAGESLIKSFEQLCLEAYLDGGGVPTIGWGHTKGVRLGDTCTTAQAEVWFQEDVGWAVAGVNASLKVFCTQYQFDALVSFTYNVGASAEAHSTLIRLMNAGDLRGAAAEFPKWDRDGGVEVPGLKRRRLAEQALFMTGAPA